MFLRAQVVTDGFEIALAHAPHRVRAALCALWAYDAALGRVVATTTEPMIGQLRLTWWHERMIGLDAGEVPSEPVIAALADVVRDHDVSGEALAALVEGWEVLLDPLPLEMDVLRDYARGRGDALFDLSARVLGASVDRGPGAGWALIDFAMRCSDAETSRRAWQMAREIFDDVGTAGSKSLRMLAGIAKAKAYRPFQQLHAPLSRWSMLRAFLS